MTRYINRSVIVVSIVLIITRFKITTRDHSRTTTLFYFNDLKESDRTTVSNSNKAYEIIIKTN
jgi:hypothetical protein